jgi:hypothetical protein
MVVEDQRADHNPAGDPPEQVADEYFLKIAIFLIVPKKGDKRGIA